MAKTKVRDGVFQREDRHGWWVSYINASGERRKQKVMAHTRKQAADALSAIKTLVERDKILGVKASSDITTEELLARYKRHQKARIRPSTLERLDSIVRTLRNTLPERARDISRRTVAENISYRTQTGTSAQGQMKRAKTRVAPGTVQKEVTVLKHALKLAVEWELLRTNAAQGAKLPKLPQGRTRYLSPSELKCAVENAPQWMRGPIALAAFTGMRRGELLALRWMDVDLENCRLYLNNLAIQVLTRGPKGQPSDAVFPSLDGQKLSVYTRRLFKRLDIQNASFHSLRHTAASWLVMQGVELYAVGQLLGHRTPRMTQRYAHLSPSYMAGAVGKLDSVFGDVLPKSHDDELLLVPTASPGMKQDDPSTTKLLT